MLAVVLAAPAPSPATGEVTRMVVPGWTTNGNQPGAVHIVQQVAGLKMKIIRSPIWVRGGHGGDEQFLEGQPPS